MSRGWKVKGRERAFTAQQGLDLGVEVLGVGPGD